MRLFPTGCTDRRRLRLGVPDDSTADAALNLVESRRGSRAAALSVALGIGAAVLAVKARGEENIPAYQTSASLYELCSGAPGSSEEAMCFGYISATADMMLLSKHGGNLDAACVPTASTPDQLIEVMNKYLGRWAHAVGIPGWVIVVEALHETFPCIRSLTPGVNSDLPSTEKSAAYGSSR